MHNVRPDHQTPDHQTPGHQLTFYRVAKHSPPFYTLRFARGEFRHSGDLMHWLAPLGKKLGHSVVRQRLHPVPLPHARFCYMRHGANAGPEHAGQRVTCPAAQAEIRHRFGLEEAAASSRTRAMRT